MLLTKKKSKSTIALKISDFGISRKICGNTVTTSEGRGDADWTAREIAYAKDRGKPAQYVKFISSQSEKIIYCPIVY